MTTRSVNDSLNDDDSNIDLEALDTESASDSGSSLNNSHLSSADDEANSNSNSNSNQASANANLNNHNAGHVSTIHRRGTNRNNSNNNSANNHMNNAVLLNDDFYRPNPLSHIQSNKSSKSRKSTQVSFNDHSVPSSSGHPSLRHYSNGPTNNNAPTISKFPMATRQSTYNSTLSSTNTSSYIAGGTTSNLVANRYHNGNGNGNGNINGSEMDNDYYYGDDYDTKDLATDDLDHDDDTYSYDYIANSNVKLKKGDKLKTSWAMPLQNERQYKDLQIIDEVAKLQNLDFFSESYVENLENLKISQLGLLIDMVKLTENSFDEFYNIWNEFESKIKFENENDNLEIPPAKSSNGVSINSQPKKENIISSLSSDMESFSPTRMMMNEADPSVLNEAKSKTDTKKNEKTKGKSSIEDAELDVQEKPGSDLVTQFDINNSEGFKLMKKRKQEILKDLEKINSSIDQIDAFTKSMWTKM